MIPGARARSIAIIGAGLSGLTLAHRLEDCGTVTLFDKSRGVGGRMAHRHRAGFDFDHGAQYFTARGPEFQALTETARAAGAVAEWPAVIATLPPYERPAPRSEARLVGLPGMSGLCTWLATGADLRTGREIARLDGQARHWVLVDTDGARHGPFDLVVAATPAPQAARLLPPVFAHRDEIARARMSGCFTLMIGLARDTPLPFDAARLDHPVLSWVARNASKPGRSTAQSLVAHSRNDWAEANLEEDRAVVRESMLDALSGVIGADLRHAAWIDLHRWRYANVEAAAGLPYLLDTTQGLAACGDWCIANRVEAAFESGAALAAAIRQAA